MKKNLYIFCSVLICMSMHNSLGMQNKEGMLELPSGIKKLPSCGHLFKNYAVIGDLPRDNRAAIERIAQAHDCLVEGVSLQANGIYGSSIQAINNIWGRLRDIELLTVALVKNQQMLNQESYQYAMQRALIEYKSRKSDCTRPNLETYLIKMLLEGVQEDQPALFNHPNDLVEKKEG